MLTFGRKLDEGYMGRFKIKMLSPEMSEALSKNESVGPFLKSVFIGKEDDEPKVAGGTVSEKNLQLGKQVQVLKTKCRLFYTS